MRNIKIEELKFKGKVVSGIGEGRKYVEIYSSVIEDVLGIKPFPGTLNIDVGKDLSPILSKLCAFTIPPPSPKYKPVLAFMGAVEGVNGYFIKPYASIHGGNIIEFITSINMRKTKNLKDGDTVELVIYKFSFTT
ncbi:CTP-dependent riboflavin kinase [Desulfurococcaceae archaeon MEX13E-LK6-19]|nr:CTP-dependent riboflavin kinase [Desulfurococcaceae archaeon MEX13E-LK6-19]